MSQMNPGKVLEVDEKRVWEEEWEIKQPVLVHAQDCQPLTQYQPFRKTRDSKIPIGLFCKQSERVSERAHRERCAWIASSPIASNRVTPFTKYKDQSGIPLYWFIMVLCTIQLSLSFILSQTFEYMHPSIDILYHDQVGALSYLLICLTIASRILIIFIL